MNRLGYIPTHTSAVVAGTDVQLVDAGAGGLPVLQGWQGLGHEGEMPAWYRALWGVAATVSFGASVYHGYKRNDSLGWGIWWGLMGAVFPVITPVVAVAQGFGKRKR
jgi:hypothetical protein